MLQRTTVSANTHMVRVSSVRQRSTRHSQTAECFEVSFPITHNRGHILQSAYLREDGTSPQ